MSQQAVRDLPQMRAGKATARMYPLDPVSLAGHLVLSHASIAGNHPRTLKSKSAAHTIFLSATSASCFDALPYCIRNK